MENKELFNLIKNQGEGIVYLKNEYKIILEDEKNLDPNYQYSRINSVVFDGEDSVKITYANYPSDSEDFYNRYTNLKSIFVSLKEVETLNFVK